MALVPLVVTLERSRIVARSLSGYLCGTHSGPLAFRRADLLSPDRLGLALADVRPTVTGRTARIGDRPWHPPDEGEALARALRESLDHPHVEDLVVYGSQARGTTTGFSDLDAILVISDEAARTRRHLRALRRRVLSAQRAVLAHQPVQHHGFEVVTPALLENAGEALAMPAVAMTEASSLTGNGVEAQFGTGPVGASTHLTRLVRALRMIRTWPRHPWELHRSISMFELLPTLWLQAKGTEVPKWESFEMARLELEDVWWPFETLARVRQDWPGLRPMFPRGVTALARNPWISIDLWRRLPARPPSAARSLDTGCLAALHSLAEIMIERSP